MQVNDHDIIILCSFSNHTFFLSVNH